MPRQPRFVLPGVCVHIIQRGNNRAACFVSERDYCLYLLHVRELSQKFECSIHAYCLMPNHVHLLMTPLSAAACTGFMRELGQRYVQYFNRRYGRSGSLWEGRFRSCITDSASYVLACYRYIELNPVRACLVSRACDYEWSSYRINAGQRSGPMIEAHPEYLALGLELQARLKASVGLFDQALEPSLVTAIRKATHAGYPLGSEPGL